jgi:hypothetical protein
MYHQAQIMAWQCGLAQGRQRMLNTDREKNALSRYCREATRLQCRIPLFVSPLSADALPRI